MKILRIVYDFPPPWQGLAPGPYELTQAQVNLGNTVHVLCGEWPKQHGYANSELRVTRLPRTLPYLGIAATYAPAVLPFILRHERSSDVIHGHNFHPAYYHWIRKQAHRPVPYVLHMHITAAERRHKLQGPRSLQHWFEWQFAVWAEKIGCTIAQRIICVSDSVKQEVLQWYKPDPSRVVVIPNGVNTNHFSPQGPSVREQLGLERCKIILFVGTLTVRKRVDKLIESLMVLPPNYRLLVIGDGSEKHRLEMLAAQPQVAGRVIFVGNVSNRELPPYYRAADVFCLLSAFEGMPKVILEALASGLPVITSKTFALTEMIDTMVTRIETDSTAAIADAIHDCVEARHVVDFATMRKMYDWNQIAEQIQHLYAAL